MPSIAIANHPERNVIRAQLAQNIVLKEMVDAGHLGRKSGKGFFDYGKAS